jgi:tRNA (cytidine/uridine-2'-O-)-methyltransferase
MQIILYQPQIPQNTGNVVRSCSVTRSSLVLVTPLGFSVTDRWLKRAGLDYWEGVNVTLVEDFPAYLKTAPGNVYFFSSKAEKLYTEVSYSPNDWLVFGSETVGLPAYLEEAYSENFVTLPMQQEARCLNLATSVGIGLYEAWRQCGFNFYHRGTEI